MSDYSLVGWRGFNQAGGDKMKTQSYQPSKRELDPSRLITARVQYWRHGIVHIVTNEEAREAVREGRAFVVCDQAIRSLDY